MAAIQLNIGPGVGREEFTLLKFAQTPLDADYAQFTELVRPDTAVSNNTLIYRSMPADGGLNSSAFQILSLRAMVATGVTQGSNFNPKVVKPGWTKIANSATGYQYDMLLTAGYKTQKDIDAGRNRYTFYDNPIGAVVPYPDGSLARWCVVMVINFPYQAAAQAPDSLTGILHYKVVTKSQDYTGFQIVQPPYNSI